TKNNIKNNSATLHNATIGLSHQFTSNIQLKGSIGLANSLTDSGNNTAFLTDFLLQTKPFKLQLLEFGYQREIQRFNADLLERQILMNNFYINYSINTNIKLGGFAQYYYTSQNDGNVRNLLFTSLYYSIVDSPSVKVGLNYQYIAFKNQLPTIYFSPKKFNATEAFINFTKEESIAKPKEWFYELTAAGGIQYIEDNKRQSTYRIQFKLGYKPSERALFNLFGTQSNIASTTAAGFTFTEIGLRFKWYLLPTSKVLKYNGCQKTCLTITGFYNKKEASFQRPPIRVLKTLITNQKCSTIFSFLII
ncbi:MAG: hypothetical protein JKY02_01940, partial [Flavobacteriaceae bacterium]|nr:hypothetical protein [Flavobacteriaceae bacterium]